MLFHLISSYVFHDHDFSEIYFLMIMGESYVCRKMGNNSSGIIALDVFGV
jgi:hypothetical protein